MIETLGEIANYGVLGTATITLTFAVRHLYKRNCEQSDRISNIIEENSIVIREHSAAIKGLTEVIKERGK